MKKHFQNKGHERLFPGRPIRLIASDVREEPMKRVLLCIRTLQAGKAPPSTLLEKRLSEPKGASRLPPLLPSGRLSRPLRSWVPVCLRVLAQCE